METANTSSTSVEATEIRFPKLQLKKIVLRDLSTPESLSGLNRTNQEIYKSATSYGDSSLSCGCCC